MTQPALKDHVVVVTGGAGRLGREFCLAIAGAGGTAIVADVDRAAAEKVASEICAAHGGGSALAVSFDISDAVAIDGAIADLDGRFGRIDAVVNSAYPRNARYGARAEDVTYADFAENVSRHTGGYFITAQRFAGYFARHQGGNIVFLGSIYGVVAPRFGIYDGTEMTMPVEYAVIKAGIIHLTRYLAQYYKARRIRVNALSPGGIFADQPSTFIDRYVAHTGAGRMLGGRDVAEALLFLLSPASRHVNGQNLVVDDGWTL